MSNRMVGLLAMVAVVCLVGSAAFGADESLRGKVVSVDAEKGTLVVKPRQGDNVTVTTDKDTKVTVDGKEAKLADVKADMLAEVTPKDGVAKTIVAKVPIDIVFRSLYEITPPLASITRVRITHARGKRRNHVALPPFHREYTL